LPQTLSHIYPFSLLPENHLEELSNNLTSRNYQPGEYIFREKEPARNGLFLVFNGILEIVVTSERGQDIVISLRRPGEFFGEAVPGWYSSRNGSLNWVYPEKYFYGDFKQKSPFYCRL